MNTNVRDQERTVEDVKKYGASILREGEREIKEIAGEVEKHVKQTISKGKESLNQVVTAVDKEVREHPWSAIGGVAVGCLLLGFIMGSSRR